MAYFMPGTATPIKELPPTNATSSLTAFMSFQQSGTKRQQKQLLRSLQLEAEAELQGSAKSATVAAATTLLSRRRPH